MFVGAAPQVQLAELFATWQSICTAETETLSVQHQVVCLSCLCELAHTAECRDRSMLRRAIHGPEHVDPGDILWLASRSRMMQMMLPFSSQAGGLQLVSGIASRDLDLVRRAGGVSQVNLSRLLDIVGQWHVSPSLILRSEGLLTQTEQEILREFFAEHTHLLREPRSAS